MDRPALEMLVPVQAGSSCLACSISCCGSNGLPTNPWAPRAAASPAHPSSTLPLNMTTGIASIPWRPRAPLAPRPPPAPPQHLPAVDLGHHHVEQDEVGRPLLEHFEPLVGTTGLTDRVALHLEIHAHILADALVIVDDQDDGPLLRSAAGP